MVPVIYDAIRTHYLINASSEADLIIGFVPLPRWPPPSDAFARPKFMQKLCAHLDQTVKRLAKLVGVRDVDSIPDSEYLDEMEKLRNVFVLTPLVPGLNNITRNRGLDNVCRSFGFKRASAPRGDGCRAEFAYTRLMDAFDLVCATEGSAHGGGEVLQAFIDQLSAAARLPTRPIGHRTPGARARGREGVRARARRAVELAPADVSTRAALAEAAACDESLYNLSLQVGAVRRCSWLGRTARPQPAPTFR